MKSIFRDKTTITIEAGQGGAGGIFFDKQKRPIGGFGGDGGDVFIEGDTNMPHFKEIRYGELYKAENGQAGQGNNKNGAKGESLLIKVPLITRIFDEDKKLIGTIEEHGQRIKIASGGKGGVGNIYFRGSGNATREKSSPGDLGEKVTTYLELELDSDIIFIGYPNAGKSSLITELTNAKSKIGSYAFTTIFPVLGSMDNIKLLDLPGLIEDTHQGKGLGTGFVKHTRQAKMIAHFVSFENDDMHDIYNKMRKELENIDPELALKPEVIILTKSDLVEPDERKNRATDFEKKYKKKVFVVSTYDIDALENIKSFLKENLEESLAE